MSCLFSFYFHVYFLCPTSKSPWNLLVKLTFSRKPKDSQDAIKSLLETGESNFFSWRSLNTPHEIPSALHSRTTFQKPTTALCKSAKLCGAPNIALDWHAADLWCVLKWTRGWADWLRASCEREQETSRSCLDAGREPRIVRRWSNLTPRPSPKTATQQRLNGTPTHLRATGCHLPYGITQCYLPPNTSESEG